MKELNVYLHFNGQAREALKFYVRCFDGEIKQHMLIHPWIQMRNIKT